MLPLALLVLAAPVDPVSRMQPDSLPLGVVRVGSKVQASVMALVPGRTAEVPFTVAAPPFVTVRDTKLVVQEYGAGNWFRLGLVEIELDTATAGDLSGDLIVTLDGQRLAARVSATVRPPTPGRPRVLVTETPFHGTAASSGTHFQPWTDLVAAADLDVSYLSPVADKPVLRVVDLSRFDTILIDAGALVALTSLDITRARKFAEAGGRVILTANYFFRTSVAGANKLLAGSGLEMRDEEARGDDVFEAGADALGGRLTAAGVKRLRFRRASPVAVTDPARGQVLVKAGGVGQSGDGFVARTTVGKGEYLVLGESLWWNWITPDQAKGADNATLLRWLLTGR